MIGWHHRLNGHEFEQTPGDSEGQGSLACCSPWGCKELDTTVRLNNNSVSCLIDNETPTRWKKLIMIGNFQNLLKTLYDPMKCSCQASLSFNISGSLLKLMFIELMMPSNHLILCHPLLLLPSVSASTRVSSKQVGCLQDG